MTFNPNAPLLMGPEWPVGREGVQRVDSDFAVAAAYFASSATETIDSIGFWLTSVPFLGGDSKWEVEIYNAASLDSGVGGLTQYAPTVDASYAPNIYHDPNTYAPSFYDHIDESMGAPNAADWVSSGLGSPWPASYAMRFGGITGSLTGKVITKVSLLAWAQAATGGTGTPTLTVRPILQIDGVRHKGAAVAMDSNNPLHFLRHEWLVNPITGVSWKIADVEKFAADADSFVGWEFDPTGSYNFVQRIFTACLQVDWGTTERRVAVGTLGPVGFTRSLAFLATPAGADNWAKATATNYLILVRRRSGGGAVTVRWLDSGAACPHASHGSVDVGFLADGRLDPLQVDVTNRLTPAYAISMARTDFTGSADSQPYGSVNGDDGTGEAFLGVDLPQVDNAVSGLANFLQQEFTPGATTNYQSIQVLVSGTSNLLPPDANLVITVKRRSDNVQFGGTFTITPAMLAPPYGQWRTIRGVITNAALVSGTQYYFDIQTGATPARGWRVQVLSGMETNAAYDPYNFGGTTDRLTKGVVLTDISHADAVISISQAVTNVTNFAAAAQDLTLTSPTGWVCSIGVMQKVHLTWTKTSLGASFLRYEIDRYNEYTALWENIAMITTEATQAVDDLEARVGVLATYRIRTLRTTSAASDWSTYATATPTWGSYGDGLLFVSNENPVLACGFLMQGPTRGWTFLNAPTIVAQAFQGRDFQVAFRDLEERGVSFDALLFLNDEATPARKGEPVFQALRDIADAPLSYAAVKNKDGEVWYASVAVNEGQRDEPGNLYTANVTVLQTTATPSVIDA